MRGLWILIIVLFTVTAQSQDLVLVSKVEKDSISIKWLPSNFSQLKSIAGGGVTISRMESAKLQSYATVNFDNAKKWLIEPTKIRYDKIDESTKSGEKHKTLLDPLFESSNPKELENFAFGTALIENIINPRFQFVLGNITVDKEFEKNKTYVYKVEVKGMSPYYIFVDPKSTTTYLDINDLTLSLDKKKVVDIEWSSKRYEKEAFGFDIEHSIDKASEGEFLTEVPYLPFKSEFEKDDKKALYRDNAEPGHFHFYRIHGRDMFGHKSLTSEWKKIYVPLLINAWTKIDTIYATKTQRIVKGLIHSLGKKPNIERVELFRSLDRDKNYELVESVAKKDSLYSFSIDEENTGDHYYYKLSAINKDDTVSSVPYYFFTLDQKPPAPPENLKAEIDSNGIVKLNWSKSIDDDIRGYKVYRANSKKEEFVERTKFLSKELLFIDTLALDNLTSEAFYFLRAVDMNYNQSAPSDTLLLIKPDTIAPVSAIVKDVVLDKNTLRVVWINSGSKDVKENYLLRYSKNSVDTSFTWSGNTEELRDSSMVAGKNYRYEIVTIDKSGNKAISNQINRFYEPGYRSSLNGFKAVSDVPNKSISLSWDKPQDDVYSYKIFRGKSGEKVLSLKTISDPDQITYKDKSVKINNKYIYTVKYINQSGIHSIPAKVEVIYQ